MAYRRAQNVDAYEMFLEAIDRGTGARALRSIFEKLMLEVMYDAPSIDGLSRVTVDREFV